MLTVLFPPRLLVSAATEGQLDSLRNVPCGVDAVAGMAQILDEPLPDHAARAMAGQYRTAPMRLLEVVGEIRAATGRELTGVQASFDELLWLDRPVIMHLWASDCATCPEGLGHALAIERLTGEWAISAAASGTRFEPVRQLRAEYAGDALVLGFGEPTSRGAAIAFDSYVMDMGNIPAGQPRRCRLTVRNGGSAPLAIQGAEADGDIQVIQVPKQLAPRKAADLEMAVCPSHTLGRGSETRTSFLYVHSNDSLRPRASVAVRYTVVEPVLVSSPVVYFPRVTPSERGERAIFIECLSPVRLVGAAPAAAALGAEFAETGSTPWRTRYELRLTVDGKLLRPGLCQIPVALDLDGVGAKGAELLVRVRVWPG
jgi:hypothetical protein